MPSNYRQLGVDCAWRWPQGQCRHAQQQACQPLWEATAELERKERSSAGGSGASGAQRRGPASGGRGGQGGACLDHTLAKVGDVDFVPRLQRVLLGKGAPAAGDVRPRVATLQRRRSPSGSGAAASALRVGGDGSGGCLGTGTRGGAPEGGRAVRSGHAPGRAAHAVEVAAAAAQSTQHKRNKSLCTCCLRVMVQGHVLPSAFCSVKRPVSGTTASRNSAGSSRPEPSRQEAGTTCSGSGGEQGGGRHLSTAPVNAAGGNCSGTRNGS
jgi:hypothetical protein